MDSGGVKPTEPPDRYRVSVTQWTILKLTQSATPPPPSINWRKARTLTHMTQTPCDLRRSTSLSASACSQVSEWGSRGLKSRDGVWRAHSRGYHYCVIADGWTVSIILTLNAQSIQGSRTPDVQAETSECMAVEEGADADSPEALCTPALPSSCLSQPWRPPHTGLTPPVRPRLSHLNWDNKVTQPLIQREHKPTG